MPDAQLALLDAPGAAPEGFLYTENLISADEEGQLLEFFRDLPFREFEFQAYRGKRRVVSFGLHYDFAQSKLRPATEIPAFLLPLRAPVARFAGLEPQALVHVLITEYPIGAPIGWHKDRPVFGDVIGISLLSPCRFRFRRKLGARWERVTQVLEPRSAYLLRGPARTEWEHSIPEAESLRYSITFRTLKNKSGVS